MQRNFSLQQQGLRGAGRVGSHDILDALVVEEDDQLSCEVADGEGKASRRSSFGTRVSASKAVETGCLAGRPLRTIPSL